MAVQHFKTSEFDSAISAAPVAMVDFWAEWCGPCKMVAPFIEEVAQKYDGKVVVGKVNVDEEMALAQQYGVMSIPTVIFFKDGKEVQREVGLTPGVSPAEVYGKILDQYL